MPNPAPSPTGDSKAARLGSLDAYRGFVMFLMMGEVFRCCDVAARLPDSGFWKFLCHHQSHSEWVGCTLHDLIQPSFSFLVGAAVPFSIAARRARGASRLGLWMHAGWRALALTCLGVFLRSTHSEETRWVFEDTLSQIGMGYLVLFGLGWRSVRTQWVALGVLLVGYWAAFALYPLPASDFDYGSQGVNAEWLAAHGLTGFAAHWNKNSNLAWAFDRWWMNLFPRSKPFEFNDGGYCTLSFVPTLATMTLGLIVGGSLRNASSAISKVLQVSILGIFILAAGYGFHALGICPIVKRIWTPSWVLFSGGWCCLFIAAFYLAVDGSGGLLTLSFPLRVIGMNSMAAYLIAHLFDDFIARNLKTHLGQSFFEFAGTAYEPFVHGTAMMIVFWAILYWMWRQKLFVRL